MPNRRKRSESRYTAQAAQLADLIRDARTSAGLSQQQLASRAEVAIGTVRAMEGKRTVEPGFFTVHALALALNIPADSLPTPPIEPDPGTVGPPPAFAR